MNAEEIARILGGKPAGGGNYAVRCPTHDDKTPSLSIKDNPNKPGYLLVNCKAGCDGRDVIAALQAKGLIEGKPPADYVYRPPDPAITAKEAEDAARMKRAALDIWRQTIPAEGTPVEAYLRGREIDWKIPPTIRFHPAIRHSDHPGKTFPAMIAAITVWPSREIVAIHRTYLAPDGSGKADIADTKKTLGQFQGGAVRLGPVKPEMYFGEGIENTMSAASGGSSWAALNAENLSNLILPDDCKRRVIAADNDKPTERHPRGHGVEAAYKLLVRSVESGFPRTTVILPQDGSKDFNDQLRHAKHPDFDKRMLERIRRGKIIMPMTYRGLEMGD